MPAAVAESGVIVLNPAAAPVGAAEWLEGCRDVESRSDSHSCAEDMVEANAPELGFVDNAASMVGAVALRSTLLPLAAADGRCRVEFSSLARPSAA